MALRQWVVRTFGEDVARKIEQFVEGSVFGDTFVECPGCQTPVASVLLAQRQVCPICHLPAIEVRPMKKAR